MPFFPVDRVPWEQGPHVSSSSPWSRPGSCLRPVLGLWGRWNKKELLRWWVVDSCRWWCQVRLVPFTLELARCSLQCSALARHEPHLIYTENSERERFWTCAKGFVHFNLGSESFPTLIHSTLFMECLLHARDSSRPLGTHQWEKNTCPLWTSTVTPSQRVFAFSFLIFDF
jgi:hypothetical protein